MELSLESVGALS